MDSIDIGIYVSIGLLVMVVLGMRVAFAAAMAGLVGLVWVFWAKKGYDPSQFMWAMTVATKTAGQVPHSKVASQALSLIPTFILIGYLAYYAGLTRAGWRLPLFSPRRGLRPYPVLRLRLRRFSRVSPSQRCSKTAITKNSPPVLWRLRAHWLHLFRHRRFW